MLIVPPTMRKDASIDPGAESASSALGSAGSRVPVASSVPVGDGEGAFGRPEPVGDGVGEVPGDASGGASVAGGGVGSGTGRGVGGGFVGGGGGGGVGSGVGTGASVTVTIGPTSGAGCGSAEVVALKVTCQVPAGRNAVPCQVPSLAEPLTLVSGTDIPATSAEAD
jgi:hypothetical protein